MSDPAAQLAAFREAFREFHADRWHAHQVFFAHRHREQSAPAHREMVERIHSTQARHVIEGFRRFGKSTYLEEAAILRACYREFHNMIVVGASYARAVERLAAIKREIETNERLLSLFGTLRKPDGVWQEGKIVLANGVCIQALGRDQSMLGMKHFDWRPDAALIDDVEDPDEVRTDADRSKTWDWFMLSFLPSLDDPLHSWVRVLGTRRGRGSLPERLEEAGWPTVKYPLLYIDESGAEAATWPAAFPVEECLQLRRQYRGSMDLFSQEYMCKPFSAADRVFTHEMLRAEPRVRKPWQAVYAMYDPARTTNRASALTGWAVWSWEGSRLVFWEAGAESWLPDRIIDDLFRVQREYEPTWLGFEEDGLNEWAKQPIRTEMLKRRTMLPMLPVKAPRSKHQFIAGLQPYMNAGEVVFAGDPARFAEAWDEFLAFPTGKIDAPNACAYALLLRPGSPVYEAFSEENIGDGLEPIHGQPLFLAGNADGSLVTAALVQRAEGEVRILADWVREGRPDEVVADIHAEADLRMQSNKWEWRVEETEKGVIAVPERHLYLTRMPIAWILPGRHNDRWRNVGLVQAVRAIPQAVSVAPDLGPAADEAARAGFASIIDSRRHGRPCLQVGTAARWTLRALAGGYAKSTNARGFAAALPDQGIYRLLMEGIEAFCMVGRGREEREADPQPVAYDRFGQPYKSAMPNRGRAYH